MRRNIVTILSVTALFSGCAYQGVVVEKRFRPIPFPYSLGVDAMYNFKLRDNAGQTNSQMVTPDVFATYRVGDYFNDMQPPPARDEKELEGFRLAPPELREGPLPPVRVMQMQSPPKNAAKVAVQTPGQFKGDVKILRWQTVRMLPIQWAEKLPTSIAVYASGQPGSDVKVLRQQMVRLTPIPSTQKAVAKVAVHSSGWPIGDVKIPLCQTVRIAPLQSPTKVIPKIAVHSLEQTSGDVKILRWQTVRIVPIQSREKIAAKAPLPAHPRSKSMVKTASAHNRNMHSAKIGDHAEKSVKVASRSHHKTVASMN